MDNELMLFDRLEAIKTTVNKYGEDNFYLSFSGGKDSTVLHYLMDMALPNNKIPRVFCNTGIEYLKVVEFVNSLKEYDDRFDIIYPRKNIKQTLEEVGYPFKSKEHSKKVGEYQKGNRSSSVMKYKEGYDETSRFRCPNILKYQYEDDFKIKLSDACCYEFKKKPFKKYERENGKSIVITGMMKAEGGQRTHLDCVVFRQGKAIKFHPLSKVSTEWENWFIEKHNIKLCELYNAPYNFQRTGCKGCPYSLELQNQLEVMERYMPNERKQCETIWKPIYDEYRRINYRLKKNEQVVLF